jgi:hypothetical protein
MLDCTWPCWTILDCSGPFWHVLGRYKLSDRFRPLEGCFGRFGLSWVNLDRFGLFRAVSDLFGMFWVLLDHYGSFRIFKNQIGPLRAILNQLSWADLDCLGLLPNVVGRFRSIQAVSGHFKLFWTVLNCFRMFWIVLDCFWPLQNITSCFGPVQTILNFLRLWNWHCWHVNGWCMTSWQDLETNSSLFSKNTQRTVIEPNGLNWADVSMFWFI